MSDPKAPGEPVEEPVAVDDVVGTANEGLADAEAARSDAAAEPAEPVDAPVESAAAPADETPWYERDDVPLDPEPGDTTSADPAHTAVMEPAVTPAEPVYDAPTEVVAPAAVAPVVAHTPQPIFVQAPEPPRPRGNRAAAGAIGLLAAIAFAILFLAVWVCVGLIEGSVTQANVGKTITDALATWSLWIPVAVFFLAFWLLGAIINRGRWGLWVVFGLLVGVASYGGHILGQLFQAPFWNLTAKEGQELVQGQLLVPLAIAAFVIGRELTIWFGAWIAARGKRVSELNYEAQREYERTLEAGPTIVPSSQG